MDTFDLMRGNLVLRNNKPMRILEIREHSVKLDYENGWIGEAINLIKPIKLTKKIVKKIGFVEEDGLFVLKSKDWVVVLEYFEKKQWVVGIANFPNKLDHLTIDSVHELQNALTLCKIKKEINL